MDFRQLRQFVVLATELNYRKAAERLHMTQPPLSIAIKRLEEDVGVQLFERDRQGVRLTMAGGTFLREVRHLLESAEAAVKITQDAERGRIGTLRISSVPSAALQILPRILQPFTARFPSVRLHLSSGSSMGTLGELQRGELDIALLVPPSHGIPGLVWHPLCVQRLKLAVPANHKASRQRCLQLNELRDETLIALAHSDSPGFAGAIMSLCQHNGFQPHALQESSHALITLPLIAAGLGVAIIPEALSRIVIEHVAYLDLADANGQPLTYQLALATQSQSINPAVPGFLQTAIEALSHCAPQDAPC